MDYLGLTLDWLDAPIYFWSNRQYLSAFFGAAERSTDSCSVNWPCMRNSEESISRYDQTVT